MTHLTRDFHPSQVLIVDKTQRYGFWGAIVCSGSVVSLMTALIMSNNLTVMGILYTNQILLTATSWYLSHMRKQFSEAANLSHYQATQSLGLHLQTAYAPSKNTSVLPTISEPIAPPKVEPFHPVLKALFKHDLECELVSELKSPSFVRTLIKPTNCTASKVLRIGEELQLDLALNAPPIMSIRGGAIAIDTPRSDRQIAKFADYWKPSSKIEAAIGVDINNRLITIDLSNPETCHILAAGTTGSGKSVWLQSLLLSLLIGRSPQELQVVICDVKQVSFFAFKDCANLLVPILTTPKEVIEVGNWIIQNMENRYKCFAEYEAENIDQYNAIVSKSEQLPRILFLLDEYGDLKSACTKKESDEIEAINIRIGEKARASGIIQAIVTQRALKVITPRIRANCPARVLLKVAEKGDTESILGDVSYDGRNLLGRGDLFFDGDRLQSLLCEPSDFAKLTKGRPVYDPEDLSDPKTATVSVKSESIAEPISDEELSPMYQKIVNFLDGREWVRDNYIKQSIFEFKQKDAPLEDIQSYLKDLQRLEYVETRNAGRNGIEARKI